MATGYDINPRQIKALILLLALLPLLPTALIVRYLADAVQMEKEEANAAILSLYQNYAQSAISYLGSNLEREIERLDSPDNAASPQKLLESNDWIAAVVVFRPDETQPEVLARTPRMHSLLAEIRSLKQNPIHPKSNDDSPIWKQVKEHPEFFSNTLWRDGRASMLIRSKKSLLARATAYFQSVADEQVGFRILENYSPTTETLRAPETIEIYPLSQYIEGWAVELRRATGQPLDNSAAEQARVYLAISISLVIVVLSVAALAGYAITRQLRLNDLRNTAVAAVAHELKTPVASSQVLLDTLLEGRIGDADRIRDYHIMLSKENARLGRIVSEFLILARLEQRNYKPRRIPAPLANMVGEALADHKVQLDSKEFAVDIKLPDHLPPVLADPDAIRQAFSNIIDNAIKYSPQTRQLRILAETVGSKVRISFQDAGIGIPQDQLRKIFRAFHQLDSRLARCSEGCGLGLNIVREIAKAHQGSVWAENNPGHGITIHFTLPAAESAPTPPHHP